jgi:hypothetical protein
LPDLAWVITTKTWKEPLSWILPLRFAALVNTIGIHVYQTGKLEAKRLDRPGHATPEKITPFYAD